MYQSNKLFKFFLIYYICYCLVVIGGAIFLGVIVDKTLFKANTLILGYDFMFLVLEHNLKNFTMYLFLPLLAPLLQLLDLGGSILQITLGFRMLGVEAFSKLLPHGLLEFPNLLLYQGMSQYVLFTLMMTKSVKKALHLMKEMLPLYLLSLIILIIAAILEGFI